MRTTYNSSDFSKSNSQVVSHKSLIRTPSKNKSTTWYHMTNQMKASLMHMGHLSINNNANKYCLQYNQIWHHLKSQSARSKALKKILSNNKSISKNSNKFSVRRPRTLWTTASPWTKLSSKASIRSRLCLTPIHWTKCGESPQHHTWNDFQVTIFPNICRTQSIRRLKLSSRMFCKAQHHIFSKLKAKNNLRPYGKLNSFRKGKCHKL